MNKEGNFKNLYKFNDKVEASQAARRAKLLEEQKRKREEQFNSGRPEDELKYKSKHKHYRVNLDFKDSLMMSEWMLEAPEDLDSFVLIPCPKGVRCTLSVDSSSVTAYYRNGKEFKSNIKSNLPKDTVLDCFYVKKSSTFYVIDILQYKSRDFINCDYAMRSYWLRSKFDEEEFKIFSPDEIKLKLIDSYDCADHLRVTQCYQTCPIFNDETELDGYLYYHKEGSYTFGECPLVLWLFPFMVEEMIPGHQVHPDYNEKPENYTNCFEFIKAFNDKRKNKSRRSKNTSMDFETSTEDPVQQSIDLETHGEY